MGTQRMVTRPDAELFVREVGGRHTPAVVLLHGLGGWSREWDATVEALEGTHHIVAFDQRGHGESTRRPADLGRRAHVDDVLAVMDALDVERATLVGQSAGGHTAMLVAARAPDRVDRLVMWASMPMSR